MITDTERREVAQRLRGLNSNISHVRRVYEAEGIYTFCDDQADYYQICYAIAGYLPAEHMHPCDYEELHDCLADLIEPEPERTCRDTSPMSYKFTCSECHSSYRFGSEHKVWYCPYCGAKVVRND